MEVQIFGVKKSSDTRTALRFFSERRIKTHFVDFAVRPPAIGELRRFSQRFGVDALIDRDAKRFAELGWSVARYSDDAWLERLSAEPTVLRMPLVRFQQRLTIGLAPDQWKQWVDAESRNA